MRLTAVTAIALGLLLSGAAQVGSQPVANASQNSQPQTSPAGESAAGSSQRGQTLLSPVISVSPSSLESHLFTGGSEDQTLTVTNQGTSDLILDISSRLVSGSASFSGDSSALRNRLIANHDELTAAPVMHLSHQSKTAPQASLAAAGVYTGDYLSFGLSSYGEIMPFQFPVGNEHLRSGTYLSGYTLAYRSAGMDRIAMASYDGQSGIVPVSYTELQNTPSLVVVEVVTKTSDNLLTVTQTFSFDKHDHYINIQTQITNASGGAVTDVVFKSYADWDTDGIFENNWNYDLARNMIYAWQTHYTAIASSRVPDLMDIDGWYDYNQRATTVDYPTGPLLGYDGLELLHFALGDLAAGSNVKLETVYGAGSTLAELQGAIDRGAHFVPWLQAQPTEAVIPAGTSQDFTITFDATGFFGGEYQANLVVSSNDPTQPEVNVPANLFVTGAPDIAVSPVALDFGTRFVGYPYSDTILVRNTGTDVLHVTSVSSTIAEFVPGLTSFNLAPTAQIKVPVTFTPSAAGPFSAVITFNSDDPDQPEVTVALAGQGILPPAIAASPSSLESHLFTGGTEDRTLTISNQGRSDLLWKVDVAPANLPTTQVALTVPLSRPQSQSSEPGENQRVATAPAWRTTAINATLRDLHGVTVLYDQAHDDLYYLDWSILLNDLSNRGATVTATTTAITPDVLANVDIVCINDHGIAWTAAEQTALKTWLIAGGGLLIEGDETLTDYNALLASLGAGISYIAPGVFGGGITTAIASHQTTVGVTSLLLDNPLANLTTEAPAVSLVRDLAGGINVACSQVGSGRIVVMANENLGNGSIGSADNQLFGNQVFDWLAEAVGFVRTSISSGTVSAGMSQDLTVTFDATSLYGGEYQANLAVSSNDPAQPEVNVPANLFVTGAPDIAVSPVALDFGTRFVGYPYSDTILVRNTGTDLLHVTSVSSSLTEFVPGLVSFDLAPTAQQKVPITFTPSSPDPFSAIITFSSNDPDAPTATISAIGQGLIPPVAAASPDSLVSHLFTGETEDQTLRISNSGGSDLSWTMDIVPVDVLHAVHYSLAVPASRPTTQLVEQEASPQDASSVQWRTTAIEATLLDLHGVRILFDSYHSGYNGSYNWSLLIQDLQNRGATVAVNTVPITSTVLQSADIVWVVDHGTAWTTAERTALKNWLTVGGGLLLEGDENLVDYNALLTTLGAGITYVAGASGGITTNITPHQTTTGVAEVYIDGPLAHLTTSAPAGPLVRDVAGNLNVAYSQVGGGRIIAMANENFIDYLIGMADNQLFGNQVFDWLSGVGFVRINTSGGTVAAGASQDVTITFDATGLFGGEYLANLVVSSNDPTQPELRVPAHLSVTGVPDIVVEPDSLVFDSIFVGLSLRDTMIVRNRGTDLLTVGDISAGNEYYLANPKSFGLEPGDSQIVEVAFTAGIAGDLSTVMTFTSNDPNSPAVHVPVHGRGLVPPVIEITPASLAPSVLLTANPTREDTLTVHNTGGSSLVWTARLYPASPRDSALYTLTLASGSSSGRIPNESGSNPESRPTLRPNPLQAVLDNLTGIKILFDKSHSTVADLDYWSTLVADLRNRGATVTVNTAAITSTVLQSADILWVTDHSTAWTTAERTALKNWLTAGGGLLVEGDESLSDYNALLASLGAGISYATQTPTTGVTAAITSHQTTSGVTSLYLDNPLAHLATVTPAGELVRDSSGNIDVAYSQVGSGRILVMADENFCDWSIGAADNQLFGNQVFDWLAIRLDWLTVTPMSGTVAAGSTNAVAVRVSGVGLPGGEYAALVGFTSNDPATPYRETRVTIHVQEYLCGDANADGIVNGADLSLLFRTYFSYGPPPVPSQSGDLNCDGLLNLADICLIARFLSGGSALNCCR